MNGHHADLAAGLVELPLDLHVLHRKPFQEARERWRLGILVSDRLVEKRVDALRRLVAEARDQLAPAAVDRENPLEQLVRHEKVGPAAKILEHAHGVPVAGLVFEEGAVKILPVAGGGDPVEVLFGESEQRRFEDGGQRQIVAFHGKK